MVLAERRRETAEGRGFVTAVMLALLVVACTPTPQRPVATGPQLHVAIVSEDDRGGAVAVPPDLRDELEGEIARVGRVVRWVDLSDARRTSSQGRMAALSKLAPTGQDRLLIETRTSFYTELEGRFRWVVDVKFTIEGDRGAESERFDVPAILNFSHYGHDEALIYAAPPIAAEVRRALSGFVERERDVAEPPQP